MWSWEELEAAPQHIFSDQLKRDVEDRYSRWGGIPRYVLQKPDAGDQDLLQAAVDSCSLSDLAQSITDLTKASEMSHRLVHLTVEEGYLEGPVKFASQWVQDELMSKHWNFEVHKVHDFLAASAGEPALAAFREELRKRYTHVVLQDRGSFSCRDLDRLWAC